MITLKTLPEATAQQVFDQVATHLLTQKKKAGFQKVDGTGIFCKYRHEGLTCAAGCLIADDEYKEEFEKRTWQSLVLKELVPGNHEKLISELQIIHDTKSVEDWHNWLSALTKEYKLNADILTQFA